MDEKAVLARAEKKLHLLNGPLRLLTQVVRTIEMVALGVYLMHKILWT